MSKLPRVGTTIFTVMSQMANQYNAINLSQGFPNFPVDEKLVDLLREVTLENVHQYAPMSGSPALLGQVGQLIEKAYGRVNDPGTELLITAGATQAIFATIQALVAPGEEVIILDPSYDCYEPPVVLTGAIPVHISLKDDFSPDWEKIEKSINAKTRLLIINNPHNPSGKIFSTQDIEHLERLMLLYPKLILLSDEVYEFITFEEKHISVNTLPTIRERSVIVSSFGKTFHITGWKIGYLIAPEDLMKEIKKVHQFLVFCVNSVAQAALSKYLDHVDVMDLGKFYQEKRDFFKALMQKSRFELLPSQGTYFQLASYAQISELNDVDFCKELVEKHGVAAIPLSVFNDDGNDRKLIRFCFAKDNDTLIKATERLCKI